jgi:hypothetical protein
VSDVALWCGAEEALQQQEGYDGESGYENTPQTVAAGHHQEGNDLKENNRGEKGKCWGAPPV